MSVTTSEIETLVRYLIGDVSKSLIPGDIFTYTSSKVFNLSESNPIAIVAVFKNGAELGSGEYSFDNDTNKVTVTASLVSGDTIEIEYTYYSNYSSDEIKNYVRAAIVHLSVNNYYDFEIQSNTIYPEPEVNEKNLIAMVTSLLIEPDNVSYSLPDIRITVPRDLPLHEKISKTIAVAKKNSHGVFTIL